MSNSNNNSSNRLNVPEAGMVKMIVPYEVRDMTGITVLHQDIFRGWST